ncbi:MAG: hypothetical protein HZA62_12490 [Rhodocyclales bacterium]|nr:hypothetical protein [Rhodocyclales bacterium]
MTKAIAFYFALMLYFTANIAHAQASVDQVKSELVSAWVVTVDGELRKRLLRISGIEQRDNATFSLNATYGWIDAYKPSVKAEIVQSGKERTLTFVTGSNSKIVATQNTAGVFVGTFSPTSGPSKGIRLVKVSDDELFKILADAQAAVAIVKPAENVPPACAAFSGKWSGMWSYGGIGQQWLWIMNIDSRCMAKIAYQPGNTPPTSFEMVEIKDGTLEWICNKSTMGTCVMKRNGNDLWANYHNPSGGTNAAVFSKIE